MQSTPVFIIGGYLGAGKTSLVNHILGQASDKKLAIIVNDFGSVNIDADLILARDEQVIELTGGCLCCQLDRDLSAILMDLTAQDRRFDAILVEASGVAKPSGLAAAIPLIDFYCMGAVIIMCDAASITRRMKDRYVGDLVCDQVRSSDLIILNKADLVPEIGLVEIQMQLMALSPGAELFAAKHAQVPLDVIFNASQILHAEQLDRQKGPAGSIFISAVLHGHFVDAQALARALSASSIRLQRAKGFVYDRNGACMILQVTGDQWSLQQAAPSRPRAGADPENQTRIVCIGVRGEMDMSALSQLADQFQLQVRT